MLERVEHDNGVVTYQSPTLRAVGVLHGFTTRHGGYSKPPYDSLNLGALTKGEGDANTAISENFRRVRTALKLERIPRYEVKQVHAAEVWDTPDKPVSWPKAPCADALVSDQPGRLLCIRTADCVPILLASMDGKQVAAVHAGWRGLVAGVIEAAVGRMTDLYGVDPSFLVGAIGPCISAKHFEVGEEVAERFSPAFVRRDMGDKPHVDLVAATRDRLEAAGIMAIDLPGCCTYASREDFFSHRRDVTHEGWPDTGRMAALITARLP